MDTAAAQITTITGRERVAAFVELTKPRIAFMLVLTAAAGFYVGNRGTFDLVLFANAMIGIVLLAFGVATLNQWLERRTDVLMDRTSTRPLPTGSSYIPEKVNRCGRSVGETISVNSSSRGYCESAC